MATREDWQGTATQLKLELDLSIVPNHLSRQLKEAQPILLDQGIEITFPPRREYGQLIHIAKLHKNNPTDRLPENPSSDRQSDQNEGETIAPPPQPDRQTRLPAATGTAPPVELPPGSSNVQSTPTTLAKMDPQIVTAEEPKEEPIKVAAEHHQTESVVLPEQSRNLPMEAWTSHSAVDLPVGNVDCRFTKAQTREVWKSESGAETPVGTVDRGPRLEPCMTVPPKADRQIVRSEQNKEQPITLRPKPDRQALLPAATAIAAPAELPASAGPKEMDPEVIQAPSVTTILVGSIDASALPRPP